MARPFYSVGFWLVLSFLGLAVCAPAAEAPPDGAVSSKEKPIDAAQKPVLSALGRKRVRDNIATLAENIRDLHENLGATKRNIDTINQELKDLDGLDQEHLALKKKYQAYLDYAEREMKKNEKSTRDLEKWEKSMNKSPQRNEDKALKDKLETARLERADRARWKIDAESKVSRVNELMKDLLDNLRDIRSRRGPLQEQQSLWVQRQHQYESLLSEMTQKKSDLEDLLRH